MAAVVDPADAATAGLRERKKQRTRALLVDAAVKLCLTQGYENTTVEQIAAAADVSPRTFSRYFATKDAVYLSLFDTLIAAVADGLAQIDRDVPPLRAIKQAHVNVLERVAAGAVPGVTSAGIAMALRIINPTEELRLAAGAIQSPLVLSVLAERMDVEVTNRRLRLVMGVWSAIIVTACTDLLANGEGADRTAQLMAARITESFDHFTALAAAAR